MKKFTFLVVSVMLLSMSVFAQNLIENPGFENWTDGAPDSWTTSGDAITLSQNTVDFHEGASSCQVVFTSQDNQNLLSTPFAVNAGDPIAVHVYFYDNDPAGRARLSILFEGGNYYGDYTEDQEGWQMLSYEGVVPDGTTEATLQIRFYDVDPWDGDAEILVDETSFVIDDAIKPEPSNYPTDFATASNGATMTVSWTDAIGDQLPQDYLVYASTSDAFTAPIDGTPVADDTDLSDGSAVVNISYGSESTSFGGLDAGVNYYFTIYPYTNEGADIDYKTDGTAPTASQTMPDVSILNYENFDDNSFGDWTAFSVLGDQEWELASYGNPGDCAKMTGYDGAPFDNEDWFISPALNLDNYSDIEFIFETAMNYDGPAMELFISSDYTSGDPTVATWESISFTPSEGGWEWTPSGTIDLSPYTGTIHLGFKFTSTSAGSSTWEIDNILITGTLSDNIEEYNNLEFNVYPNPGYGIYQISNPQNQNFELRVYNILGKQIMETMITNDHYTLDIQDYDRGVYLLEITSNQQKKTLSLIKK